MKQNHVDFYNFYCLMFHYLSEFIQKQFWCWIFQYFFEFTQIRKQFLNLFIKTSLLVLKELFRTVFGTLPLLVFSYQSNFQKFRLMRSIRQESKERRSGKEVIWILAIFEDYTLLVTIKIFIIIWLFYSLSPKKS